MTQQDVSRIKEKYGLDQPLPVQYLKWFRSTFIELDFGRSYITGRPVSEMILERIPATLELMGTAFITAILMSIVIGVLSALNRGGFFDQLFSMVSVAGMSIPVFWFGLMAILVFSVKLGITPSGGREALSESVSRAGRLPYLILPSCVLAVAYLSTWSHYIRSGLIEALDQDFIRTARAKGLAEKAVVLKHALRCAILPFVASVSMQVSTLFTGAVITETVFSWPGMGTMFYQGILRQDYTRILGIVVVASLCIILFNTLGDLACYILDPRGREGLERGLSGREPV